MKPRSKASKAAKTSFAAPAEPQWHRMIAEAAYFRAERRGFAEGKALEDWLAAEEEIRKVIAGTPAAESR